MRIERTRSFEGRVSMEEEFAQSFARLFDHNYRLINFGSEVVTGDDQVLKEALYARKGFQQAIETGYDGNFAIQYMPDYILFDQRRERFYFVEVKHSIRPLTIKSRIDFINKINSHLPYKLDSSNIGVIAREAIYSYKKFYPNTILVVAAPYNGKLLMAEKVSNIDIIFAKDSPNNNFQALQNYEIGTRNYFDYQPRSNTAGSGTPHANINLDQFQEISRFFSDQLSIQLDRKGLVDFRNKIKNR